MDVEQARNELAEISARMAVLRDLKSRIDAAKEKKQAAITAADDLAAAVATAEIERLSKDFSESEYGQLSGRQQIVVNEFVASGPKAHRLKVLEWAHRLIDQKLLFPFKRKEDIDPRLAEPLAEISRLARMLTTEIDEIRHSRRAELAD